MEKIFPWHPTTSGFDASRSLSAVDAENLRGWGFNLVRLGTMWPGVEAVRGEYNVTYLRQLEVIVNNLAANGIETLLQEMLNVIIYNDNR